MPRTSQRGSGGGGAASTYTQSTPVPLPVGGIAAGEVFSGATMQFMWDDLLQQYVPPQITLATSPLGTTREIGTTVSSVTLTATTVAHTNPITAVRFYRNGVLIHTVASPAAGGGAEVYVDSTPVTANTSYTAQVDDGTSTVPSNTVAHNFLPMIYRGVSSGLISTGSGVMAALSGTGFLANSRVNSAVYDCSVSGGAKRIVVAYPVIFGFPTGVAEPGGGPPFNAPNPGIPFGVAPALVPLTDYTVYRDSLTNVSGFVQDYYIVNTNLQYSATNLTLGIT
jgi:hypothetical protein